jgi:hypothetical protein
MAVGTRLRQGYSLQKHHTKTEKLPISRKEARRHPNAARKSRATAQLGKARNPDTWDESACKAVIYQLWDLRGKMLAYESTLAPLLEKVHPS